MYECDKQVGYTNHYTSNKLVAELHGLCNYYIHVSRSIRNTQPRMMSNQCGRESERESVGDQQPEQR